MNELTRRKISLKMRGRKKSATHREHIRQALKGKKKSKEHKEHISEAMKNANKNPYYRLYVMVKTAGAGQFPAIIRFPLDKWVLQTTVFIRPPGGAERLPFEHQRLFAFLECHHALHLRIRIGAQNADFAECAFSYLLHRTRNLN